MNVAPATAPAERPASILARPAAPAAAKPPTSAWDSETPAAPPKAQAGTDTS